MPTQVKFNNATLRQYNGNGVDYDTDTIKIALLTSSFTPAADTQVFFSEVNTNEVSGTNYTAGGAAIANMSVSKSTTTVTITGDNVSWSQSGTGFSNARYAVVYKDTGTPATSPLISYADFGANVGNTTGDLEVRIAGTGLIRVS